MSSKRKAGRPKLPKSLKKVGFSTKVRPALLKEINYQTKERGRNTVIEEILERNFCGTVPNTIS